MSRPDAPAGELLLTDDEHKAILALIRPYPDGTLPPGFVSLVVEAKDRLARFRDGVMRVMYPAAGGIEELCVAAVHTCPVITTPGEHNFLSRYCFKGDDIEWWIILPGARMLFIIPEQPLRPGYDVVATFEILPQRKPTVPNLILPFAAKNGQVDITVQGAR